MLKKLYVLTVIILLLPVLGFCQISFKPYQNLNSLPNPEVATIGDVNNDGLPDLVTGNGSTFTSSPRVSVFLQDQQAGLLAAASYFQTNGSPGIRALAIADVNNDLRNDVIIGYYDSIGILYQNASGTLNPLVTYYSGGSVSSIKTGDLNNDGLKDIVVSHFNSNYIKTFYQTTNGFTTTSYATPPASTNGIEVADVNGDTKDDVVIMNGQWNAPMNVFIQNTTGTLDNYVTYATPPTSGFTTLLGIATGDLNNDGLNDIVATRPGNNPYANIVLWLQDPVTHTFQTPFSISAYDMAKSVRISDLDCDGKNEIIVLHDGWAKASVYTQDSMGVYTNYTLFSLPYSGFQMQALALGDLNNDGRKDIVAATSSTITGPSILWNNTIPANATIDTFSSVDTLHTIGNQINSFFTKVETITDSIYQITTVDSFLIIETLTSDKVTMHDTIIKSGYICSGNVSDSTISAISTLYYYPQFDTSFYSRHIDTISITGINNVSAFASVVTYPNPVTDILSINIPENLSAPLLIKLYSSLGELITTEEKTGRNPVRIKMTGLSSGVYYLKISNQNKTETKTIIKQ